MDMEISADDVLAELLDTDVKKMAKNDVKRTILDWIDFWSFEQR